MKHPHPTWRYRLCLRLASPIVLLHLLLRSFKDGGLRYFKQRLGLIDTDSSARIHIHAASVGEVICVLPLIEKFQKDQNSPDFLITTNTPTAASILDDRLPGNAVHAYLPIDFAGATYRFYNALNINSVWIVETEIWPWLYARAKQSNIPLTIINARMSDKSQGRVAQFFAKTYRRALSDVRILAKSVKDANRYEQRGAAPDLISTMGNLKFASTNVPIPTTAHIQQRYVLAASTHDDEEVALAEAWLNSPTDALLVISPRHVERAATLVKQLNQLQKKLAPHLKPIAQRSKAELPTNDCRVYLADTLGELPNWYAHANAAFVGGSLIERGGHNVLEPARLSTPVIVGHHTHNFKDEVALLESVQGIEVANSVGDIVTLMNQSLANTNQLKAMGARAQQAVDEQSHIVEQYYEVLAKKVSKY